MKECKIDVPVLLIFFVRDDTFSKVFEAVKQARPSTLLLWQDGPRKGREDDVEGIRRCREIAENIDWDCTVYRHYNEENLGCDPSTFYAQRWAFSLVDKCIVLEDDQMPSQSYFQYCKELLERYEFDERVNHICGYNFLGHADWCPNDYFFTYTGTGAWASWRRVAEKWDSEYTFLQDEYAMQNLKFHYGQRSDLWLKSAHTHANVGKAFWESILGIGSNLDSRYAIVPKVNLVHNLGISENATHSTISDLRIINKSLRQIYLNPANEMEFPMKHPKYVIVDAEYTKRAEIYTNPSRLRKTWNKVEIVINMIRYCKFKAIIGAIRKRLVKRG